MSTAEDLVTLTANCLCKTNTFTTQVPKSKLPLEGWACHCDSCRHVTGALFTLDTLWPEPRANVDISKLKAYSFSPKYNILSCPTCSTPMFWVSIEEPERDLGIFTATLRNDPGDLVKIGNHIFVGDTKDGGASMWLRKSNTDGTEAKRYKESIKVGKDEPADPIPYDWPSSSAFTGSEVKTQGPIPIWCKCKGVNLVWEPNDYTGKEESELPWFIDPTTHKALGGFCACESCRLAGGCDVWNWTFTELSRINFADKRPGFPSSSTDLKALVDAKDPSIGTLTYYASSPEVQRYFCSHCSATIFYASDDRTFMVDIAVGVIEAPDGARAESWLSWAYGGAISHLEENKGGWRYDLFQRVAGESEDWRVSRNYPKNWRRLAREKAETTS